jgi:hypothetical protein
MRYRVETEIEVRRVTTENLVEVAAWCGGDWCAGGVMVWTGSFAHIGDFIVRYFDDKFGVIGPEKFAEMSRQWKELNRCDTD